MDPQVQDQIPLEHEAGLTAPIPVVNVSPLNIAKFLHKPTEYDGKDRTACATFIAQVRLFITGSPQAFPTEASKVLFTITYLRNRAFAWVEPKLNNDNDPLLSNFNDFMAALQKNLGETDRYKVMGKKLRVLKQTHSVSNYRTEFENISQYLSWGDEIFKQCFYDGLKDDVKDALALVQDEPDDLVEFQELCTRIDNRLYERKQEAKGNKPYEPRRDSGRNQDRNKRYPQKVQHNTNVYVPRPSAIATGPGPMDLDASNNRRFKPLTPEERQHRMTNKLCLYCGKPGHRADACPVKQKPGARLQATLVGPMDKPVEAKSGN